MNWIKRYKFVKIGIALSIFIMIINPSTLSYFDKTPPLSPLILSIMTEIIEC